MLNEYYERARNLGEEYLKAYADGHGWKFYSIIEDSYEYENGLMVIGYSDEASLRAETDDIEELGHYCIDLSQFQERFDKIKKYVAIRKERDRIAKEQHDAKVCELMNKTKMHKHRVNELIW